MPQFEDPLRLGASYPRVHLDDCGKGDVFRVVHPSHEGSSGGVQVT